MPIKPVVRIAIALGIATASSPSHAFLFFFPIPNLSKPAPLNTLIDALEKSDETKAVAYVSEDKTFGSKYWVWGHHSGHVPQAEADRIALSKCQAALSNAKAQSAGGKPLYDYGSKSCELYSFANKTISPRAGEWTPAQTAPAVPGSAPITSMQPSPPASAAEQAPKPAPSAPEPSASAPTTPVPTPPVSSQSGAQETPTAKKLRELEALRKDGLITEA